MRGSSVLRCLILMPLRKCLPSIALLVVTAFLLSCGSSGDVVDKSVELPASGQSGEAKQQYDDGVTETTSDAQSLLQSGITSAKEGHYDDAVANFDAAIALAPDDARAYLYRGVVSGIKGDYESATADHLRVLKLELLSPEDAAFEHGEWLGSLTMWTIYLRNGDYDKAIADYDTFTRLSPDEDEAYMWRGCAYYLKGEDEKALADYDTALAVNPDNAFALYKRGLAHAGLGNNSQASQDFTQALEIGFDDVATESAEEARQQLSEAQQLADHEQGIFHYERGLDRLEASDYDNAVADMDKARKLIDPQLIHLYTDEMHEVYFQSGVAYYDTGLYDNAIRLFDKAIGVVASPSDYPAAYFHRGMSHYRKGSHRRAIADFDMLVGLEQDFPDAAHYSRLARGKLSE